MKTNNKILLQLFLLGVFIRLVFIPFATSADLLSMYYRSDLRSTYGLWGMNGDQSLSHYIYALWLSFLNALNLLPKSEQLYPLVFGRTPTSYTASVGDWLIFINHPQINKVLFLLKIPHLLADAAVFWILAKIFDKNKRKNLILALWWFNPVNIYAFYIFSRHDSLTALALLLSLIFLAKEKIIAAALSIFAAIQIRFQPLFYLPLFIVHWVKNFKNKKRAIPKYLLATLIVLGLILIEKNLPFDQNLLNQLKGLPGTVEIVSSPSKQTIVQKVFNIATSVGGKTTSTKLIIFSYIYALVNLFYFLVAKAKKSKEAFLNLSSTAYLSLALYFVFNDFSPHYFVWLSLFASISGLLGKKFIFYYLLSILGWGLMGLMSTDNFAINQNLFLPISPLFFNTPQIGYSLSFAPQLLILGKIIFNTGLLLSSYQVFLYLQTKLIRKPSLKKLFIPMTLLALAALKPVNPVSAAKYPLYKNQELYQASDKQELKVGEIYFESFTSPVPEFSSIDLRFDTSRNTGSQKILFRLKEKGQQDWLVENEYDIADFYNRAYYPFGFLPIDNTNDKSFIFELELLPNLSEKTNNLPLFIYPGDYILSTEKPTSELAKLIREDLKNHIEMQKNFFIFYFSLLSINLLMILVVFARALLFKYHKIDVKN